jgi:hypothetical protein
MFSAESMSMKWTKIHCASVSNEGDIKTLKTGHKRSNTFLRTSRKNKGICRWRKQTVHWIKYVKRRRGKQKKKLCSKTYIIYASSHYPDNKFKRRKACL